MRAWPCWIKLNICPDSMVKIPTHGNISISVGDHCSAIDRRNWKQKWKRVSHPFLSYFFFVFFFHPQDSSSLFCKETKNWSNGKTIDPTMSCLKIVEHNAAICVENSEPLFEIFQCGIHPSPPPRRILSNSRSIHQIINENPVSEKCQSAQWSLCPVAGNGNTGATLPSNRPSRPIQ